MNTSGIGEAVQSVRVDPHEKFTVERDVIEETKYKALTRAAHALLRRERPGHLMEAGDIVHNAVARTLRNSQVRLSDTPHLAAILVTSMKRSLIDSARAARALKSDCGVRVELDERIGAKWIDPTLNLTLTRILLQLKRTSEAIHIVVVLHCLEGMTFHEIALTIATSERTAKRRWKKGQAWIASKLMEDGVRIEPIKATNA